MRYFISIMVVLLTLIGCGNHTEKMELTGTVKGLKKGTLLLQKFDDTTLVSVDSMVVDGNSDFVFSEKINSPEIYYLYVRLKDGTLIDDRIPFFAENGPVNIKTNLKQFGNSAVISGSENNKLLSNYNKLKQRYINKNLELIEQRLKLSNNSSDSLKVAIDKQRNSLLASKYLATINYALQNKEHEVAPYLMLSEVYDANIKYLDTVYNVLTPKVKDSKYGKELESFIKNRKKSDTIL